LEYEFENSVGYWVVMAAHALQRALNEELAPHGMTHRQWQVLCWLAIDGPLPQNELAERMNIEPATLVSVLARMERNGWIGRRACPSDGRRRVVFPKPKAKPIWEQGVQCARRRSRTLETPAGRHAGQPPRRWSDTPRTTPRSRSRLTS
jgi:MarR family transcriptional regulator for hemolysin